MARLGAFVARLAARFQRAPHPSTLANWRATAADDRLPFPEDPAQALDQRGRTPLDDIQLIQPPPFPPM